MPKLSRDCRDHCCPGEHRLELWAALDAHGDIHEHVLNSPVENAIPWFLGSWHKGLLLWAGKAPKGSRAVQVTQLCPKVQEQGANPQHLQVLSASQGSLEALESGAQTPAGSGKPLQPCQGSSALPSPTEAERCLTEVALEVGREMERKWLEARKQQPRREQLGCRSCQRYGITRDLLCVHTSLPAPNVLALSFCPYTYSKSSVTPYLPACF